MMKLYENIKLLREAKHMTQTELALKCGYSDKSMIAKIEHGQIDLPISKIETIAKALDVSPNDLLDDNQKIRNVLHLLRYAQLIQNYKDSDHETKTVINRLLEYKENESKGNKNES